MCALSFFHRPCAVCLALVLALAGFCWSPAAAAQAVRCNGEIPEVQFGQVHLLNGSTANTRATLSFRCDANPGDQVLVCVGLGPNQKAPGMGSMTPRYLDRIEGGPQASLAFNLYSDSSRTNASIWGDFSSGDYQPQQYVMYFGAGQYYQEQSRSVYGQIVTQGQTGVVAGQYGTELMGGWPMRLRFKTFTGATVPSCFSGGMSESYSTFYIGANVAKDCRIDTVSDLDFGTVYQTLDKNIDSATSLTLTCVSREPHRITLSNGQHAAGPQRQMQGPGGALLKYELFTDAARTESWPSEGFQPPDGSLSQQLRVYGRVPPQKVPVAGAYSDTVTVTVTY